MPEEVPYSKRELDKYFTDINSRFDIQDKVLADILGQTRRTNGRVNKLENWKWFITGAIAILTFLNEQNIISLFK